MDEVVILTAEGATGTGMPVFQPEVQDAGRNAVFGALVKGDGDITGLVAYSIFKQNELDWLTDFRKAKGREPTEDEADAYILGESTLRRLATYRHLADATLAGNGPDVASPGSSTRAVTVRQSASAGAAGKLTPSTIATVAIGIVILIVVYFVARTGVPK